MLTVVWPSTFMMVWSFAPRSASWVPTVCRNRWAEAVAARPPGRTRPAALQASWIGVSNRWKVDRSLPWLMNR